MARKAALGRGLNALLSTPAGSDDPIAEEQKQANGDVTRTPLYTFEDRVRLLGRVADLEVEHIRPNPYQPRKDFNETALNELSASITQLGIIQPITVRAMGQGQFEVISGERRLRAARRAGLRRVPAYVREADTEAMLEMALVENVQREELNPIEIAVGYQRLIEECDLTQEQVSIKVGKSRSQVANFLRLLKLPPRVQAGLRDGTLSVGHARALINVDDPDVQLTLVKAVSDDDLSVRDVEHRVRAWREAQAAVEAEQEAIDDAPAPTVSTPDINTLQIQQFMDLLRKRYSTQVSIKPNNTGGGRIELAYYSQDDLERLIELLVP